MQAIKAVYIVNRTIDGNKDTVKGLILIRIVTGLGTKIQAYIKPETVLEFAKENIEVILSDKSNQDIIKRMLKKTDQEKYDIYIKEGKIILAR